MPFNRRILTTTETSSGGLNVAGMALHRFREPGEYQIRVLLDDREQGRCFLTVDEKSAASDVHVDLSAFEPGDDERPTYVINPNGFVVFHVSGSRSGYVVVATRMTEAGTETVFDSRRLAEGDAFIARLLQPGVYAMSNGETGAEGRLVVGSRPDDEAITRRREPATVAVADSFEPDTVEVVAAQEVVFEVRTEARIEIRRRGDR